MNAIGAVIAGTHVVESVVEVLLAALGYQLLWQFAGPGRHGVDLLVLCPQAERVVAVEVNGTLRRGHCLGCLVGSWRS